MTANRRFRSVTRIGPVQVGTSYEGRGREKHNTAACTAPRCGFSADYDSRAAAELAARTHRCPVR
ncbi:mobile element transfer protein [Streptomyces sp. BPPL-273]|uniref:mobile element transfer protein n=1 Tax=Streptomyces sp. BPPL-273 TaxID=2987533 RepID=UPI0024AFEEAF|nr:mobile element transfer protein [Streptomyces sp. BPPL-273]WHM31694.1 mobile element transfer protein [Streptomyces sp. BPPL-273]